MALNGGFVSIGSGVNPISNNQNQNLSTLTVSGNTYLLGNTTVGPFPGDTAATLTVEGSSTLGTTEGATVKTVNNTLEDGDGNAVFLGTVTAANFINGGGTGPGAFTTLSSTEDTHLATTSGVVTTPHTTLDDGTGLMTVNSGASPGVITLETPGVISANAIELSGHGSISALGTGASTFYTLNGSGNAGPGGLYDIALQSLPAYFTSVSGTSFTNSGTMTTGATTFTGSIIAGTQTLHCGSATVGALSSTSFTNSGTFSSGASTFTGSINAGTNTLTVGAATAGALSTTSLTNSGTMSTGATTFTGAITAGTNSITGGTITGSSFVGPISGGAGSFTSITNSGTLSSGASTFSGAITAGTNTLSVGSATTGALSSTSLTNSGTMSTGASTFTGAITAGTNTLSVGSATAGALSTTSHTNSGTMSSGASTFTGAITAGTNTLSVGSATTGSLSSTSITNSGTMSSGASTFTGAITAGTNSITGGTITGSSFVGPISGGAGSFTSITNSGTLSSGASTFSGAIIAGTNSISGGTLSASSTTQNVITSTLTSNAGTVVSGPGTTTQGQLVVQDTNGAAGPAQLWLQTNLNGAAMNQSSALVQSYQQGGGTRTLNLNTLTGGGNANVFISTASATTTVQGALSVGGTTTGAAANFTSIGGTTPGTGVFSSLVDNGTSTFTGTMTAGTINASGTVTAAGFSGPISGGAANFTSIGATTPGTGVFTSLVDNGTSSFTGTMTAGTINSSALNGPVNGTVGATSPNTGVFTTVSASSMTTSGNITSTAGSVSSVNAFASGYFEGAIGTVNAHPGTFTSVSSTGTVAGTTFTAVGTGAQGGSILFDNAAQTFNSTLTASTLTANRSLTIPDATGTIAISGASTNGAANFTSIGATTPGTGSFTTLTASTGYNGVIGNTTPNTGTFSRALINSSSSGVTSPFLLTDTATSSTTLAQFNASSLSTGQICNVVAGNTSTLTTANNYAYVGWNNVGGSGSTSNTAQFGINNSSGNSTTCLTLAGTGTITTPNNTLDTASGLATFVSIAGPHNGTVGATSPSTGSFTTLSSSGATSLSATTVSNTISNGVAGLVLNSTAGTAFESSMKLQLLGADKALYGWNTSNGPFIYDAIHGNYWLYQGGTTWSVNTHNTVLDNGSGSMSMPGSVTASAFNGAVGTVTPSTGTFTSLTNTFTNSTGSSTNDMVTNNGSNAVLPISGFLAPNNTTANNGSIIYIGNALSSKNAGYIEYLYQGAGSSSNSIGLNYAGGPTTPPLNLGFNGVTTIANATIKAGAIDNTSIGSTTPSTGGFTTITASNNSTSIRTIQAQNNANGGYLAVGQFLGPTNNIATNATLIELGVDTSTAYDLCQLAFTYQGSASTSNSFDVLFNGNATRFLRVRGDGLVTTANNQLDSSTGAASFASTVSAVSFSPTRIYCQITSTGSASPAALLLVTGMSQNMSLSTPTISFTAAVGAVYEFTWNANGGLPMGGVGALAFVFGGSAAFGFNTILGSSVCGSSAGSGSNFACTGTGVVRCGAAGSVTIQVNLTGWSSIAGGLIKIVQVL